VKDRAKKFFVDFRRRRLPTHNRLSSQYMGYGRSYARSGHSRGLLVGKLSANAVIRLSLFVSQLPGAFLRFSFP
jgi:hypothetical protein